MNIWFDELPQDVGPVYPQMIHKNALCDHKMIICIRVIPIDRLSQHHHIVPFPDSQSTTSH